MTHDRELNLLTCTSRKQRVLDKATMTWSELVDKLRESTVIPYDHAVYMALGKDQQDEWKDRGAFLAGVSKDGRRKTGSIVTRSCVTLDLDNLPDAAAGETVLEHLEALGVAYCVYSTAKHHPTKPRLRVVVPLTEDLAAGLFPLVTVLIARMIQPEMTWFDPTCIQSWRIMFWPVHCQDVVPVFQAPDRPFLTNEVWRGWAAWVNIDEGDQRTWPVFPGAEKQVRSGQKQADPTEKPGIVGAFCRTYDVPSVIAEYLPDVYEPAGEGRYTYIRGSTTGGAVLYENGKFLYSNHATDPAGGRLLNSWDMVRIHKFGELDDTAKPDTAGTSLPSYNLSFRKKTKPRIIHSRMCESY